MGPALPDVCGSHWCYSPNTPSLTTPETWKVVLPDFFFIFGWDHVSSGQYVLVVHHSVVMYYLWAGMFICQQEPIQGSLFLLPQLQATFSIVTLVPESPSLD